MKTRPTPETETWTGWGIGGLQVVPASFARKLERERDKLRDELTTVNAERAEARYLRKAWCEMDDLRQRLQDENAALRDALHVRINFWQTLNAKRCPECNGGGGHYKTCRHYQTELYVTQRKG